MSLTLEEIRKRFENDTMHASIVPYVKPLLERIEELEQEIEDIHCAASEASESSPDY